MLKALAQGESQAISDHRDYIQGRVLTSKGPNALFAHPPKFANITHQDVCVESIDSRGKSGH